MEGFQIYTSEKQCSQLVGKSKAGGGGHTWASSLHSPPANAIPIRHSFTPCPFMHPLNVAWLTPQPPEANPEFFSFSAAPTPGPERRVSRSLPVCRTVGQHARTGRVVHASERLHRHASPSFVPQGHSSRSPPAEQGMNAGSERSEGPGQGVGIPAPRVEMHAWPQRRMQSSPLRNAKPSAFVLPPGQHSWRALAGTYRARQLGGPRSEVDHLPRSVHDATVRTAGVRYRIQLVVRPSRSQAGTLYCLPAPSQRSHWPALSQALR